MIEKIQIICGTCGSADVRRDAWAAFDPDNQCWVLAATFDAGHCEVCEVERSLEEVPLDAWNAREFETELVEGWEVDVYDNVPGMNGWVAAVSDEDVGEVWRSDEAFETPEEAKDAARNQIIHVLKRGSRS